MKQPERRTESGSGPVTIAGVSIPSATWRYTYWQTFIQVPNGYIDGNRQDGIWDITMPVEYLTSVRLEPGGFDQTTITVDNREISLLFFHGYGNPTAETIPLRFGAKPK